MENYIAYEYKEVDTDSEHVSFYLDCYESFGWQVDENHAMPHDVGRIRLHLKRDRKIINKAELTRLQRHFEDCLRQMQELEQSKGTKAMISAMSVGLIGTAFLAGSVFAVTAQPPIIWLCVLLGIPGLIGWAVPIFLYKYLLQKRTAVVEPLLHQKEEEIYDLCEKGNKLLH